MKENIINQLNSCEETMLWRQHGYQNLELLLDVISQTSLRLKDSRIYELHKAMDGTQIGLDSHSDGEVVVTILIRIILCSSKTLNYENFTIAKKKKKKFVNS